jgi:hypothetical protein
MANEPKFYEQRLWEYHDRSITQNSFVLSSFFAKDEYGISPTKLKLSINNYKNRKFNNIVLSHQNVFLYLARFKPISDNMGELKQQIKENNNITKGFAVETPKKTIRTTTLFKVDYDVCQRITINEGTDSYYDDEKIFIPYLQFASLIKIMVDYRDSYLSLSTSAQTTIALTDMAEKFEVLNDKLTNLRSEIHSINTQEVDLPLGEMSVSNRTTPIITEESIEECKKDLNGLNCSDCGEPQFNTPSGPSCENGHGGVSGVEPDETPEAKDEIDELDLSLDIDDKQQSELESFLEKPELENPTIVDTFVDKIDEIELQKKSLTVKKSVGDCFTSKFLEGNILNLETYVVNMSSDKLPLHTFTTILARKLEVSIEELFPGCSQKEYWQMVYLTTKYVRTHLNKHLNQSIKLPQSTAPLRYDCKKNFKINKSIMHDLFLYFVYYTHLKNQLQEKDSNSTNNKNIVCFTLKAVLSPFIFSHFNLISTKDVLSSEVLTRYKEYKKLGVFDKLNDEIQTRYGYNVTVSDHSIKETINKIYTAISNNPEKFWVEDFFNSRKAEKIIKFDYDTFNNQEFNEEQINTIISLEANYSKNGHIDFGTLPYDQSNIMKLPKTILSGFDIEEKIYNNKNLKRFIEEQMVDTKYRQIALDIADKINESYHDLKGETFEYVNLPEAILKMFCIWDLRVDKKLSANYNYMKQKIDTSSLDKNTALSMLNDIEPKQEISFTASLNTAL